MQKISWLIIVSDLFFLSAKLLPGNLPQEVKPVVTEKQNFDNRGESFQQHFLELLDDQSFDAWINIVGLSMESASTKVWFSDKILIDEVKPVVAAKS